MSSSGTIYLMYHELERPGRSMCESEEGYVRYVLPETAFRQQLAELQASGFRGISVSSALLERVDNSPEVAITFDDGCETDLISAVPALTEAGFSATFYLVTGFLGRKSYLSQSQARELASHGFEVGCHSMTHRYLPDLSPSDLRHEVADAKIELEQIIGHAVEHFSCPGGRWSPQVAEAAKEAGCSSVAASRIGANRPSTDPYNLRRLAVMRNTTVAEFSRWCRGEGLLPLRVRQGALDIVKSAIGNNFYGKLRDTLLLGKHSG